MHLAHHPLVDNALVFLIPVVLAIFALRWAEKKARARGEAAEEEEKP